jgi:hypothetical protein
LLLPLLGELFVPCSSPPSMWRKFFSIHGMEPGRPGGGACHERGLARVITGVGTSRAAEQGPCPSSAWCMGRGGAPEDGVHRAVRLLEETNIREAHGCGGNLDLDKSICRAR